MTEVPTIRLEDMSEVDKRAYVIADNQLALKAGLNEGLLKEEFEFLVNLDFDFDPTITGFDMPEIEGILFGDADPSKHDPDDVPTQPLPEPVT